MGLTVRVSSSISDGIATYPVDSKEEVKRLLEDIRKYLIYVTEATLAEYQAKGQFPKNKADYRIIVDNNPNKALSAVNPIGKVELVPKIDNVISLLPDMYDTILKRSAVDTGTYKKLNYVFLNGNFIANTPEALSAWIATNPVLKKGDKIRFVNIAPYARKLEMLGVAAGREGQVRRMVKSRDEKKRAAGIKIRSPNGAYFLSYRSLYRKYKRKLDVRFAMLPGDSLSIPPVVLPGGKLGRKTFSAKWGKGSGGRAYLYPSISITLGEGTKL